MARKPRAEACCRAAVVVLGLLAHTGLSPGAAELVNETSAEVEAPPEYEELNAAFKQLENEEDWGLIRRDAIPYFANDSIRVWQPALDTLYFNMSNRAANEPTTVLVLAFHELLSNLTFYGADKLIANMMDIVGYPELSGAVVNIIENNLPTQEEMLVATWKTNMMGDFLLDFKDLVAEERNISETFADPMTGAVKVMIAAAKRPDLQTWKDLSVVMGEKLGPAIIPLLNSEYARNATSNPDRIAAKTEELLPELQDNSEDLFAKTILFNRYLPAPCTTGAIACPVLEASTIAQLEDLYKDAQNGTITIEEFSDEFQDKLEKYFSNELKFVNYTSLIRSIFDTQSEEIVRHIDHLGPPSDHQVDVLNSLANGTYSLSVDTEVLDTGFDPLLSICLANVSAAMYEYPNTTSDWLTGLGFEVVTIFPTSGSLSSRLGVLVEKEQNAVVIGIEGTAYANMFFIRSVFGWLQNMLSAQTMDFKFPCPESNSTLCEEMAEKYSNSSIYVGFAPGSEEMENRLKPALDEAIEMLKSESATARNGEKPTLYITGHSLGGALAKNTLAQVLLRGYGDAFSSITLYTFAGPVAGNRVYLDMLDDLADRSGTSVYQIINEYDTVPYLPSFFEVNQRNVTLLYDVKDDRMVTVGTLQPFEEGPANVYLPPLGYHAIKTQYLAYARTLNSDFDHQSGCERDCSVGQCGLFKCADSCGGLL
mmetsp:Transcript_15454/g.39373  ORF Transcript_15454/g.39373 Transcript_15454/m.39373 type:complete len:708 (-) Transcript_15454:130-2253(-)